MASSEAQAIVSAEALEDLGFDQVRERLAGHCLGETARERALGLEPGTNRVKISGALDAADEYRQILSERWAFPRLEYEELNGELKRLKVSGAALDEAGCMRVLVATRLVGAVLKRLASAAGEGRTVRGAQLGRFGQLRKLAEGTVYEAEVVVAIEAVFDKEGKIRDDASEELADLRGRIRPVRRALQKKFEQALRHCQKKGLLDTTLEGFVGGRRVLAVRSSFKRQVEGTPWGTSKTGSVTFIEPAGCRPLFHELEMLINDERREIVRILQGLTGRLRQHQIQIRRYNKLLIELDGVRARARLGLEMKATRPRLVKDLRMEWTTARHPLLLLANISRDVDTVAQDLALHTRQRMLVISGPNAGGKSIALKMVGLMQVMVQSGLLVPADADSCTGIFSELLVDIGDHQSIENQLSTYSSRLQRMRGFLDIAGPRSLLLLDEFGTGSDPELGGALAEVFFEALHDRGAFAVITTHYGNIKERAASLESAANGCMRFDARTLEPLYRLDIGGPGSSFTFEVASMNGIPAALISRAKGKLDSRKVELDGLINSVQKEKQRLSKLSDKHLRAEHAAEKSRREHELLLESVADRSLALASDLSELHGLAARGRKLEQFIERFKPGTPNAKLLESITQHLAIEHNKAERKAERKAEQKNAPASSRSRSKTGKPGNAQAAPTKKKERKSQQVERIAIGSTVRLKASAQTGEVIRIKGKKAVVAFGEGGAMQTHVALAELFWVS
jgi:DNA mismatch repair protein MutS2